MDRLVYLLQPPVSLASMTPCLDDRQFGLGILALAAYLRRHGYTVVGRHIPNLLWNSETPLTSLIDAISKDRPLLIAIGLNWLHFSRGAIDIARLLREVCPTTPIVIGGQHATLFAEQIVDQGAGCIDAVLNGEAEKTLLTICDHLSHSGSLPENLPGMVRANRGGSDHEMMPPNVVTDLDDLPFYDFGTLQKRNGEANVAAVSTCRGGCPYKCAFCVEHVIGRLNGRGKLTFHSADWIAEHIRCLFDQGIRRITIQDSFFIAGDKLICELADALSNKGVHLDHINIFAHPNSYSEDGFAALKSMAVAASIDFGVETGSPHVLKLIGRPIKIDLIADCVEAAVCAGVVPYTWWLSGLPDALNAERDTCKLIEMTMRVGGIPRWVSPLVLLPQTPMHENASDYGIEPRFRSFEDYARFSEISLTEALYFDDAITHRTTERSYNGIVAETKRLRGFITDNFSIVESFWASRKNMLFDDIELIKSRIKSSFF